MKPRAAKAPALPADASRSLPLGDLLAIGPQLSVDIALDDLLGEVVQVIHRTLGYALVYIRLRDVDTDALEAQAVAGADPELTAHLRATPVAPALYQALLRPEYRLSDSFLVPPGVAADPALPHEGASVATLLVPLRGRSERLLGVIYVRAAGDGSYAASEVQVLEALARQAALATENVLLAERTARLLAKEQLLAELGRDVSNTLDLDAILNRTVARLDVAFHGQSGTIMLVDEAGELQVVASSAAAEPPRGPAPSGDGSIAAWVVQHGTPFLSNDLDAEAALRPAAPDALAARQIRSYIAVPLRTGGQVIGALTVEHKDSQAFSYEDVDLLEAIAAQIGGPIAGARLYDRSQRLAALLQRRADQLSVLNSIARTATATLDLDQMLAAVAVQIHASFGYEHVELHRIDDDLNALVLAAQAGAASTTPVGFIQHAGRGLLGRTVRTASTQRVDDVRHDPDGGSPASPGTRSELCVPVVAGGRVLGVLNVESPQIGAFTSEDVAVLETTADVLAGAINNARLYHRSQEAAVLEERNRLARDLHDSVTQQLFSMTLTAQAARAHLERNPPRAAQQLERLQETAQAALAEMRALIFQLRPPALSEQGLVAALNQHVAAISRRENLRIELAVTGDERHARGAEQAFYRIVQEALNNVVKHAAASHVRVNLEFSSEQVRLSVADDGVGIEARRADSATGSDRHLGLIGMRERAAELGGTMELRSRQGAGTEVVVIVPRTKAEG
jgi:signal transduction histidine kinase